jgi:hypothetical protein
MKVHTHIMASEELRAILKGVVELTTDKGVCSFYSYL